MTHDKKVISLALQGGGSHGAFTWGVLDRLLEDDRISVEAITGASAGAVNAAVLAHGLTVGGRNGARQALEVFWESVTFDNPVPWSANPYEGSTAQPNAAMKSLLFLTRFFSPYQLNPFDANPLRRILAAQIDFENLRANCNIKLFVAATDVGSGMARLFTTKEMSADVLLASACLPSINQAVEIDGRAYWDGGTDCESPDSSPGLQMCIIRHPRRSIAPGTPCIISRHG